MTTLTVDGTPLTGLAAGAGGNGAAMPRYIAINAVLTAATYLWFDLNCTKTSTPGAMRVGAAYTYRVIAT